MPKKEYHEAVVVDNLDPEKRGRVRVSCPTIVSGEELGDWLEPIFPFTDSQEQAGWFFVPSINASVRVEIESEENSEANGIQAHWHCTLYPDNSVPEEFQENYPNRRGFKTKSGHIIIFDDQDETITIRSSSGSEIHITQSGRIELKPKSGESVYIGDGADQSLVLGDNLFTWINDFITNVYNTHTHLIAGAMGGGPGITSNVPIPVDTVPTDLLSQYHKVK